VEIEKMEFCRNESKEIIMGSFQCPNVKRTNEVTIILSDCVVDHLCLVHDCSGGNCSFAQSETTTRIERELVTKVTFSYIHDPDHSFYLLNKFYLGETLKYFNIA
jgi:hypothetical protein